ncbi:MAG: tetratricopeptide repeat protein [Acidobacteria bacterium]|nr:tetratricopeptide repeat protein [Acidobacteriota bacterium]
MRNTPESRLLALLLVVGFAVSPALATCGGGGGGGVGGMNSSNNTNDAVVYRVPWRVIAPQDPPPSAGLVLYWFPASNDEVQRSSLRESRALTLYAAQCVSMAVADVKTPAARQLVGDSKPPVAVLATYDGKALGKLENTNGMLKVAQVEKLVETEMKKREDAVDQNLKDGKDKAKTGDSEGAIKLLSAVADEKCMFPKKAKEATGELKKLGVKGIAAASPETFPAPSFDRRVGARIISTMREGLRAEMAGRYVEAGRLYSLAHRIDPADPVPLRFLGELYRHQTGEWEKARAAFDTLLSMPADPLSRAVALHGLGKMTIHEGEFKKGLALMEQSVAEFPLALAYRNLAVYWNSEGDAEKTAMYVKKGLDLDPKDSFNRVFAAVFLAASGRKDEALKIARANRQLLPASYNLAAIYAQAGRRDEALALLRRHFFRYERYQSVRAKEMMEARVDAVFDSIRDDRTFVALTSGADGRLPVPMRQTNAGTNDR